MKAKIAYLTSPAPNIFLLNFQVEQGVELSIEVSKGHLANILIDGLSFSLREYPNGIGRSPTTAPDSQSNGISLASGNSSRRADEVSA